jgi:hypothetical protein
MYIEYQIIKRLTSPMCVAAATHMGEVVFPGASRSLALELHR